MRSISGCSFFILLMDAYDLLANGNTANFTITVTSKIARPKLPSRPLAQDINMNIGCVRK